MQRGVQVGDLLFCFLMGCKHCSFKSYRIKPWIPSITELQNGNKKGGKKYLFLPPGRPSRRLPGRTGSSEPIPHALPAQTCGWYRPARHRPWPSGCAHTRRSRSRAKGFLAPTQPPRAQGSDGKVSGRVGAGAALSAPRPPAPAWPALVRALPRWALRAGSVDGAHLVPTHPSRPWFRQQEPGQGARRRNPAGRGEERAPERTPARTRARPWEGGSRRGHASRVPGTWPRRDAVAAGTRRGARPSGQQSGQRWAGPAARPPLRPASPPGPVAAGDALAARLRRRAGLLSPRAVERAVRVSLSPSPGVLI